MICGPQRLRAPQAGETLFGEPLRLLLHRTSMVHIDPRGRIAPQLGDALPLVPTDPRWLEVALVDLDAVHADHLHCERKAAQSALSLIRSYPERADLVDAMARLAHDETRHVIQVSQLMARREQPAAYDFGDDYAAALREHIRKREPDRLLDRLLVFAVIEGRSRRTPRPARRRARRRDATAQLYASLADRRGPPPRHLPRRSPATRPRDVARARRRARGASRPRSSRPAPVDRADSLSI